MTEINRDVKVGSAVVPWCPKLKCWILPSGKKQVNRRVYKREVAVIFCHRLAQLLNA